MRTKSPKSPEQLRAMIAREIEEIRAEIEHLRLTAEAGRLSPPASREVGSTTIERLQHHRHAFLME